MPNSRRLSEVPASELRKAAVEMLKRLNLPDGSGTSFDLYAAVEAERLKAIRVTGPVAP